MNPKRYSAWRRLWRRGRVKLYLLCLVWAALVAVAQDYGFHLLAGQELASLNWRFLLRGPRPPGPEIVILAIDERSYVADTFRDEDQLLQRSPDLALLEKFPFPRRVYAAAIQRLCAAVREVVALDLLFLQPTTDGEDQALRSAIEQYRSRVVIGRNFSEDGSRLAEPTVVVPPTVPMGSVAGYVNYWRDQDRFVRRLRQVTYESAEAGVERYPEERALLSFDALVVRKAAQPGALPDTREDCYIDFAGPPVTFPTYEFYTIFYDKTWKQNLQDGAVFRDKIVLIGIGGNFQHDTLPTPFGSPQEMPGVEVHAAAIATLLHGSAPQDAARWLNLLTIFSVGLLAAALLNTNVHPLLKLGWLLGLCVLYGGAVCAAFIYQHLVIWLVAPVWTMAGAGLGGIALQLVAEQWERLRLRQTLERYVSKPVADEILRHSEEYASSLGGERRALTILFSDIRGFTSFSEQADPTEVVAQLNEYFTAMTEIVLHYQGTLSKFIGDAIMAIYGAPLSAGAAEDAWRAVQTAHDMRRRLAELQAAWAAQHRPVLRIGIGINHGEVLLGNIGSPQRMEYTVVGDPVNVASRVEGLNKEFGTDILLTEAVYGLVKDRVDVQRLGNATVKGRDQTLNVYVLLGLRAS